MNELAVGLRLQVQIVRWLLRHPNILALSPSLVHWFWKSREGLDEPDLQGVFTPASYREGYVGVLDQFPGMTCGVWQHRPFSIGHVRARSLNPFDNPIVQPNFLTDERDQQVLIGGMKLARRLLRTPALAPYFAEEMLPGPGVTTDDELLDFARSYGASCYHVMGTARMGPASDPTAVVDDELRVRGIAGLRVADASIMPSMPSANICAATMMIAEKAADMIRGRPPAAAEVVSGSSAGASERREVLA
jgi:choline dehydrogenase